jgi:hypothetical protein
MPGWTPEFLVYAFISCAVFPFLPPVTAELVSPQDQ